MSTHWTRYAVSAFVAVAFAGCDLHTSLVGQPDSLCKAARDAGAKIEEWKAYDGGLGYACVADEDFLGGKGGDLGLYTKVGFMITGHDEARMDRIDMYVDQGNPDTAGEGATLLASRVEAFFKRIDTPLPDSVLNAVRSRKEIDFDTPLWRGRVFVNDGRAPSIVVQLARTGISLDRRE